MESFRKFCLIGSQALKSHRKDIHTMLKGKHVTNGIAYFRECATASLDKKFQKQRRLRDESGGNKWCLATGSSSICHITTGLRGEWWPPTAVGPLGGGRHPARTAEHGNVPWRHALAGQWFFLKPGRRRCLFIPVVHVYVYVQVPGLSVGVVAPRHIPCARGLAVRPFGLPGPRRGSWITSLRWRGHEVPILRGEG